MNSRRVPLCRDSIGVLVSSRGVAIGALSGFQSRHGLQDFLGPVASQVEVTIKGISMPASMDDGHTPAQQVSWQERLFKGSGQKKVALQEEYQQLKLTLHRKLVDRIDLEALSTLDNHVVRAEVRKGARLLDRRRAGATQLGGKETDQRRSARRSFWTRAA